MRLIDADALEQDVYHIGNKPIIEWKDVQKQSTIDAEPVRHGRWVIKDNPGTGWYRITCSECGEDVTSSAPCLGWMPVIKVLWDYCPDCGAKMEVDDETD